MFKLSVIVPVYNVEKYIAECACSLFDQTLDDIEYIFVNDCSNDKSIEILQSIINYYPQRKEHISIIHNHVNQGAGSSRNVGILNAKGEYVIFCDSDDYVEKNAYEEMYKLAIEKNADVIACGIGYFNEDGQCFGSESYNKEYVTKDSLNDVTTIEGGIHSSSCNKMVRRKFLLDNRILFADGIIMWDDLFITIKYRLYADSFLIIDKPFYHYIMHANSIVHSKEQSKMESQFKCVALINDFLISESIDKEYILMLMFLKFKSKESLFDMETLERWLIIYPESHKYIWNFRKHYGFMFTFRLWLVAHYSIKGWNIWDFFSKVKNYIKG